MEKISKRPASMRKELTQSPVSGMAAQVSSGPIMVPKAGPTLLMQEMLMEKASSRGAPIRR